MKGLELCSQVFSILEKKGFSPAKKELGNTGSDIFPCNIIVDFNRNSAEKKQDFTTDTLIIASSQKDFIENESSFSSLMSFAKSLNKTFRIEFAFTVDDNNGYEQSFRNYSYTGTENFASSLDTPEEAAALLLTFCDKHERTAGIYTTGLKKSSPLWLTKITVDAFVESKQNFEMMQKFLSMYRAGLVFGDEQMASFFRNGTQAIKIELNTGNDLAVVKNIIRNFESSGRDLNDIHYTFLKLPFGKIFWVSEKANILSLEIFGIIVIFFLSGFSFIGKTRIKYKREFSNSWFMLPLILAVSVFSLYAGQFFCGHLLKGAGPVVQLGIKFIVSVIFISVLFAMQQRLTKSSADFVYGYLLNLVSISNIFIFSILDISLFWIFAAEYLIVYATRNSRTLLSIIISTLGILIPFIPFLTIIIMNGTTFDIMRLVNSTFGTNFLFSLILYPFETMWIKVLNKILHDISAKDFKDFAIPDLSKIKNISMKKAFGTVGISAGIILCLFIISIFIVSRFAYSKNVSSGIFPQIKQENDGRLSMGWKKTDFDNMSTAVLSVKSSKPAFRYLISVQSETSLPVLDSQYDYKVNSDGNSVEFKMPDNPPEEINIEFVTESLTDKEIKIKALYETENPSLFTSETVTGIRK